MGIVHLRVFSVHTATCIMILVTALMRTARMRQLSARMEVISTLYEILICLNFFVGAGVMMKFSTYVIILSVFNLRSRARV